MIFPLYKFIYLKRICFIFVEVLIPHFLQCETSLTFRTHSVPMRPTWKCQPSNFSAINSILRNHGHDFKGFPLYFSRFLTPFIFACCGYLFLFRHFFFYLVVVQFVYIFGIAISYYCYCCCCCCQGFLADFALTKLGQNSTNWNILA